MRSRLHAFAFFVKLPRDRAELFPIPASQRAVERLRLPLLILIGAQARGRGSAACAVFESDSIRSFASAARSSVARFPPQPRPIAYGRTGSALGRVTFLMQAQRKIRWSQATIRPAICACLSNDLVRAECERGAFQVSRPGPVQDDTGVRRVCVGPLETCSGCSRRVFVDDQNVGWLDQESPNILVAMLSSSAAMVRVACTNGISETRFQVRSPARQSRREEVAGQDQATHARSGVLASVCLRERPAVPAQHQHVVRARIIA